MKFETIIFFLLFSLGWIFFFHPHFHIFYVKKEEEEKFDDNKLVEFCEKKTFVAFFSLIVCKSLFVLSYLFQPIIMCNNLR